MHAPILSAPPVFAALFGVLCICLAFTTVCDTLAQMCGLLCAGAGCFAVLSWSLAPQCAVLLLWSMLAPICLELYARTGPAGVWVVCYWAGLLLGGFASPTHCVGCLCRHAAVIDQQLCASVTWRGVATSCMACWPSGGCLCCTAPLPPPFRVPEGSVQVPQYL